MANFFLAFDKMLKNEGGYVLHKNEGDRGGWTYAGIARNFHPDWLGWRLLDQGENESPALTDLVKGFYTEKFWNPIKGDQIRAQLIAESIFDFGVNTGVRTAVKLAQLTVGTTPDGIFGEKSLAALNSFDEEKFCTNYALAKLSRYVSICRRNKSQKRFLYTWVHRILEGLK